MPILDPDPDPATVKRTKILKNFDNFFNEFYVGRYGTVRYGTYRTYILITISITYIHFYFLDEIFFTSYIERYRCIPTR